MFLLVIRVVLLPTQHLRFDMQKFYWAYAASPVHVLYGRSLNSEFQQLADLYMGGGVNVALLSVYTTKVITKNKAGSLTMQPTKHDITGMPLYQMYLYPIRFSTLWLLYIPLFCLLIQYRKLF